jgi:hypothetical protein
MGRWLALIGIFNVPAHELLLGRLSTASRALAHVVSSRFRPENAIRDAFTRAEDDHEAVGDDHAAVGKNGADLDIVPERQWYLTFVIII